MATVSGKKVGSKDDDGFDVIWELISTVITTKIAYSLWVMFSERFSIKMVSFTEQGRDCATSDV